MGPAPHGALALAPFQEALASPTGSGPGVGLFGPAGAAGGDYGAAALGAPFAVPVLWDELGESGSGNLFSLSRPGLFPPLVFWTHVWYHCSGVDYVQWSGQENGLV